ncbi:MAG: TonB-dependent receptor [Alphaproteobacteria bacterium]
MKSFKTGRTVRAVTAASVAGGVSMLALSLAAPAMAYEIEEIVVSAQKRDQDLQDVPIAVTAVGGEFLQKANIENLQDLQQVAPTVVINTSTSGSEAIFSIRGIGTAGQNTGLEQSVGVYIDGIYRGRPGSALGDYVDISQIEILRGPQNTLFGKNTSAGVISVGTRKPGFEEYSELEVKYDAENQGFVFRGLTSGPLDDDRFAISLAGSMRDTEGILTDVGTGQDLNDRDRYTLRAQIIGNLDENTELRFIADYTESEDRCCAAPAKFYGGTGIAIAQAGGTLVGTNIGALAGNVLGGGPGIAVDPFDYKVATQSDKYLDQFEDAGVSLELNRDMEIDALGPVTVTAIGAYRVFENVSNIDADFTDVDILSDRNRNQDIDETSFELRLASDGDTNLEWQVGAYYFNQNIDLFQDTIQGTGARAFGDALFPLATSNPLIFTGAPGAFNGTVLNVQNLEDRIRNDPGVAGAPAGQFLLLNGNGATDTYDYNAESYAFFAHGTYYMDEGWSVTAGIRYSEEEKTSSTVVTVNDPFSQLDLSGATDRGVIAFGSLQVNPAVNSYTSKYEDDNISYSIAIGKEIDEDTSAYVRYATGYKSGGINLSREAGGVTPGQPVANAALAVFDPEEVTAYEIGIKRTIDDGRARVNVSLYYQELEDFQSNTFNGLQFQIRNAATVISQGVEAEYFVALTEQLFAQGGIVYSDVEFEDFPGGSPTNAQTAANIQAQDLSGKRPSGVSDWNITGSFVYQSNPINDKGWFLEPRVDYQYRSDFHTGADLDPQTLQDDFFLVNAQLSLVNDERGMELSFWGRNITDEEIQNITFDTPLQSGSFNSFVRPPASYGVSLRMMFGG